MKYWTGKKKCGCITRAIVDAPEYLDDIAEFAKETIKDGLTLEHVESDEGPNLQTCKCGKTVELFGDLS